MSVQLLLNIFIAFLWMLLADEWGSLNFIMGYLVGLGLIFIMRRFFTTEFYMVKLLAMAKLLGVFIRELISSSVFVIKQVLSPQMTFEPGIFQLETKLEGDWEVTALSLLITLTPGSVAMEVAPGGKLLYIHAMDMPSAQSTVVKTIYAFEKAIMGVTRNV
ncbi:MAG: Na+/H+ antiporter subunit E [Clostridia bacterium]|jgi:multicomponent Na+:H+ antiporter subunit E|nr:Na+/H+ antiporter subunit E [Clostridia bacterium]